MGNTDMAAVFAAGARAAAVLMARRQTVAVAEGATGTDTYTQVREINARPTGIQLYVNIGNVLIWAVIDDSQSPNWQNINTVQGSGWTVIDDEQTPGWTNIPS